MLFLSAGGRTQKVLSFFGFFDLGRGAGTANSLSLSFCVAVLLRVSREAPLAMSGVGFVTDWADGLRRDFACFSSSLATFGASFTALRSVALV